MTEALSVNKIRSELAGLNGWTFKDDKLHKTFQFGDFKEAISFIVRLAMDAELQGHHPVIHNVYSKVELELTTHSAGDKVTARDIRLARTIDGFSWAQL